MEASIREPNIKHFVRLLQCAARYGDDLCMHATKESWELAVTNSSKSAFCLFTLAPSFFAKYRPIGTPEQQRRGVRCRLYVKSVLAVIGKASSVNAVEHIYLKIVDPEGGLRVLHDADEESDDDVRVPERSSQLEIKLVYHHGITKKHFLHLQSSDFLRAIIDTNAAPCGFQISAKTLRDWLDHFSIAFTSSTAANGTTKGDSQLAWRFSPKEVRVKNFENLNTSALMTEINIDVAEFHDYDVDVEEGFVDLALPMREFKATLQLAEQFNMDLDFFFSEATQPLAMSSRFVGPDRTGTEMQLFTIFCVIATTNCDVFAAPPASSNGQSRQVNVNQARPEARSQTRPESRSETPSRLARRRADGSLRSGRARASLSMTAEPASRGPSMVTVVLEDRGLSQHLKTQREGETTEPLFLPGASQTSVRMTQAEALQMAGIDEGDLEAMMDDVDNEAMGDGEGADKQDTPADWSEVDFDNIPPDNMSTQREAIAFAQQQTQTNRNISPRKSPRLHPRAQSALEIGSKAQTEPFASRSQNSSDKSSRGSRSPQKVFEPDDDIFGPLPPAQTARSVSKSATPATPKPPTLVPTEVSLSDEEFGPDPVEPTQPDGRKYTSFFDD